MDRISESGGGPAGRWRRSIYAGAALLLGSALPAAPSKPAPQPHASSVYPAGARQGSTVQVAVGGQLLRGARNVHVSGQGVRGRIVGFIPGSRPLNPPEIRQLPELIAEVQRTGQSPQQVEAAAAKPGRPDGTTSAGASKGKEIPLHPLLRNLGQYNPRELEYIGKKYRRLVPKQLGNTQLPETVLLDLTVEPGAALGDRELRLETAAGLSNPICFQVSSTPEILEPDLPADAAGAGTAMKSGYKFQTIGRSALPLAREKDSQGRDTGAAYGLPVVLNGQILPAEVDRFRVRAREGQRLLIQVFARHLVPYLADAVPGWFQATLCVRDSAGREIAFADDYRFNPDPVLFFDVPRDGEFTVEIRDALHRGREDFVYRIALGESPFISAMYPMGAQEGAETAAWITGVNLPGERMRLSTAPNPASLRQALLARGSAVSNAVRYTVNSWPEVSEGQAVRDEGTAELLQLPKMINGIIGRPGQIDRYRFQGKAGETIAAEVMARRLHSPLDSLLRLKDENGRILAWNDDSPDPTSGLLTHAADSCLSATLPADGVYCLEISDAQRHAGADYVYRLRLGPLQPDFALRVTPSSIALGAGGTGMFQVTVLRQDGFSGPIDVVLEDGGSSFSLSGGRIPAGADSLAMTVSARGSLPGPVKLRLTGQAQIGGQNVSRPAVPADDVMQAFAYHHLVPAQELLVTGKGNLRSWPPVEPASPGPVQLAAGEATEIRLRVPRKAPVHNLELELVEPPAGITLEKVRTLPGQVILDVKAAAATALPGGGGNLIFEALIAKAENPAAKAAKDPPAAGKGAKGRSSLGLLPAISYQIVGPR